MIDAIAKITLYVNNQEEAKRFWTEQVGFEVRMEQPMGPDMKWLEVGPAGKETVFVLYEKKWMSSQNPEVSLEHPSVILSAADIEKTHGYLRERGVKTSDIARMPYGSMFTFYDMDGNSFLLREEPLADSTSSEISPNKPNKETVE